MAKKRKRSNPHPHLSQAERDRMAAREAAQDAFDTRVAILKQQAESGPGPGTFAAFGLGAFIVFKALFSSPQA